MAAGLTGHQLANQTGMSQSTVSRVELGQSVLSVQEVDAWARAVGASAAQRSELLELAEAVGNETTAWRKAIRRGLSRLQREVQALEASAATISNFQPVLIPGLLQTAEYARRLITAGYPSGRPDISAAITVRMERQGILYDEGKRLDLVMAEAALSYRLGPPQVMLAQLDRIATVATLPNVSIGVIPRAAELTPWQAHGFVIFDDRGDEDAVAEIETLTAGLTITNPQDVDTYRRAFAALRQAAVFGEDARALIRDAMAGPRERAPTQPTGLDPGY